MDQSDFSSAPGSCNTAVRQEDHDGFLVFWRRVDRRRDVMMLVHQLNQVVSTVQLHRGMSMSLLAGSDYFKQDLIMLQKRLYRQMLAFDVFAGGKTNLLSEKRRSNLKNAWMTISNGWQEDEVIDNFELHSYFIEELLDLIVELAETLHEPLGSQPEGRDDSEPEVTYPRAFKQIELLNFLARQLPHVVELTAKVRGLSCHAATLGHVDEVLGRQLHFLIHSLKAENKKLRHQGERLDSIVQNGYRSTNTIRDAEMKLLFLFGYLEDDLLSRNGPTIEGYQLFKLASEVIRLYSQVSCDGWELVQLWLDRDVERWIQHCS